MQSGKNILKFALALLIIPLLIFLALNFEDAKSIAKTGQPEQGRRSFVLPTALNVSAQEAMRIADKLLTAEELRVKPKHIRDDIPWRRYMDNYIEDCVSVSFKEQENAALECVIKTKAITNDAILPHIKHELKNTVLTYMKKQLNE